jgi:hypothetical protein
VATTIESRLTLGDVCDQYQDRHVRTPSRRPRARREMETLVAMARRAEIPAANGATIRLEQEPIDSATKADMEAVRTWRRQQQAASKSRPDQKGGEVGTNRLRTERLVRKGGIYRRPSSWFVLMLPCPGFLTFSHRFGTCSCCRVLASSDALVGKWSTMPRAKRVHRHQGGPQGGRPVNQSKFLR